MVKLWVAVAPSPVSSPLGLAEPVWFSIIINGVPNATAAGVVDQIAAAVASYPSTVPLADLEPAR